MNALKHLYLTHRMKAGLILAVVVALYANLNLLYGKVVLYNRPWMGDPVAFHEQRYSRIRAFVSSFPAVGYISTVNYEDAVKDERNLQNIEMLAQYYSAQYALAPTLVYYGPSYPLVIGNFLRGHPDSSVLEEHRLVSIGDFGQGLMLFERTK